MTDYITRLATLVDKETKQILEDSLDLIKQIKYMVGIAERGTGKKCPDGERPEAFLLAYVKSLEAALAQQDAQAVPLTEKQRVYLAQAWAMLEDYAADQRQAGNDSIADGADASAHEIKLMLAAAPTPPAVKESLTDQTDDDSALAQQDAQAVPGMGRKLYGKLIAAIRNLIDAQDEPARWGCVGPTEADLAWDRVTQLANYICLGLDSPPTAPTPPAQRVTLTPDEIDLIDSGMCGEREFSHNYAHAIIEAYERKNGLRI